MMSLSETVSVDSYKINVEIARLYKEGMSGAGIAQTLGMTNDAVWNRIKRMRAVGMVSPVQVITTKDKKKDEEIARLYTEGMSAKIIGQTLGMSALAVFQRIKRMRRNGADLPQPFAPKLDRPGTKVVFDPRRATLLHLLDLKRAGHSPTRTELAVDSERTIFAPRAYPVWGSGVGSPALSCADN